MTEFVISLVGGRGTLTVDGRQPDLFGELVGCKIDRVTPVESFDAPFDPTGIRPRDAAPVVEVTLRLPMNGSDRLTLVRDTRIDTLRGPTSEARNTGPGPVALLDRWLAAHPDEPGGALIAKAREMLTGEWP